MNKFSFEIIKRSNKSKARLGIIHTPHGDIKTPAFIFCGTKATVKGITIDQLEAEKTQIILSNTYHLLLQPGPEIIRQNGGLHGFTGWNKPMFTDSGGYQVFSLGYGGVAAEIKGSRPFSKNKTFLKITEDGATFRSYINGEKILLTPERSIQTQIAFGADIIVCLDECTAFHIDKQYTANSMRRSNRWAIRCLNELKSKGNGKQALLFVLQGGVYKDLREESTDFANSNDFDGFAVGGSLGKTQQQMYDVVNMTMNMVDSNKYVHLLGIGGIKDIFNGVKNGIDTFDCVAPTRIARHGIALTKAKNNDGQNYCNLNRARFSEDLEPISSDCNCYTCTHFSRSYIHHLLKAKELLGGQLVSIHNIRFMNCLMEKIRESLDILDSVYSEYCE